MNLLDNIAWHTLTGPQAAYAAGAGAARRYARGFSPIIAFEDPGRPGFADLADHCRPGEHFYCDGWSGSPPPGWRVDAESTMFKMLWQGDTPATEEAPQVVRLGPEHVPAALELTAMTNPGPFGPRTIELGDYFGWFEDGRLVAMAGERMQAGSLREISGVCTHPRYQGRGMARRLMLKLIRRQRERAEVPFLHVMRDNVGAHRLYEKLGFSDDQECVVRVVTRV